MRNYNKTCLLAIILSWGAALMAQLPSELSEKYAQKRVVRLNAHKTVEIDIKKDNLEIREKNYSESYLAGNAMNGIGEASIGYEPPFTKITDVKAYSLVPKEGKDKYAKRKVKSKSIEDKKVLDKSVFHDGTRIKSFTFPESRQGAITVMEYTKVINEPHLLGRTIFASSYFTQHQMFELIFDEKVNLDIQYVNCDSADFDVTYRTKGKQKIWRWEQKNREEFQSESNSPSYLDIVPHIVYRIKSYQGKSGIKNVLRNVGDLYAWYREFIEEVEGQTISPNLRSITDSLLVDKKTEYEKAKAIYGWVNHSIRYIAVEDGLGGFIPRSSNQVCDKRYGDCKDMSNIMVDMMQHAGLKARHVWIGTRQIPYSLQTTPSALVHNHMIAALELNGEHYFLDATNKNLAFPYPSEFTQNKEGLIGLDKENFEILEVPVMPALFNADNDSIDLYLNEKSLKGVGSNSLHGYTAQDMMYRFENYSTANLQDYMSSYYKKGNNNCKSNMISHTHNDSSITIDYKFQIPNYAYANGKELYLNLNLEKKFTSMRLDDDRKWPLQLDRTHYIKRNYKLHVPKGYVIKHLPEAISKSFDDFGLEVQYKNKENDIYYTIEITINTLEVSPEQFGDWNAFIDQLKKVYNQSIVIHKS